MSVCHITLCYNYRFGFSYNHQLQHLSCDLRDSSTLLWELTFCFNFPTFYNCLELLVINTLVFCYEHFDVLSWKLKCSVINTWVFCHEHFGVLSWTFWCSVMNTLVFCHEHFGVLSWTLVFCDKHLYSVMNTLVFCHECFVFCHEYLGVLSGILRWPVMNTLLFCHEHWWYSAYV